MDVHHVHGCLNKNTWAVRVQLRGAEAFVRVTDFHLSGGEIQTISAVAEFGQRRDRQLRRLLPGVLVREVCAIDPEEGERLAERLNQ
jgi:hypothetical protein